MATLVLVSVPIMFAAIIFEVGAFVILTRASYLSVFSIVQIQSLAMTFVSLHITGVHIAEIFWGLWLFPLGYLVYKSNFIPKIISILLVLSGISYCIGSMAYLVNPTFFAKIANILSIPETIGEVTMLLWLLIKGVIIKNKK